MKYVEAQGPSLSREAKQKPSLHHIEIFGHPDGGWLVEHHASARDRRPVQHSFVESDGHAMLAHLGNAAGVPAPENEEKE